MKSLLICILSIILVSGCSPSETYTPYDYVLINKAQSHKYEIEIQYLHTFQGGNIHMPLDLKKHEKLRSTWIYTNKISGTIQPQDFIITWKKDGAKFPYATSNVKGYIKFINDRFEMNIMVPIYSNNSNTPTSWKESKLNGTYKIKNANKAIN